VAEIARHLLGIETVLLSMTDNWQLTHWRISDLECTYYGGAHRVDVWATVKSCQGNPG